ncbi:MAG: murein L,D-transpeptidase family protein [Pseudomonadota bacterium]
MRATTNRLRSLAIAASALALAACATDIPKHLRPVPYATVAKMEQLGVKPGGPVLMRIFKQESELELWKKSSETGRFIKVKTYEICRWSGNLGPKYQEGDRQAPEGFYHVTPALMNPNSSFHLSFNLGFPNAFDQSHGRTGSHLMVHGACSSAGCYAMEDDQIEEIFAIARESFDAGQKYFQVQAFPFRMTPENMAKHHDHEHMPFWRMLKEGHDHFEVTKKKPNVQVCDRRYVFNAESGGYEFDATSACPAYEVPEVIQSAVAEKQFADLKEERIVLARLQLEQQENAPTLPGDVPFSSDTMIAEADNADPITTASVSSERRGLLSRIRGGARAPIQVAPVPETVADQDDAPVPEGRPALTAEAAIEAVTGEVTEDQSSGLPILGYFGIGKTK